MRQTVKISLKIAQNNIIDISFIMYSILLRMRISFV